VIQVLESVQLFFVKVIHFLWRDNLIIVEVNDAEPVIQRLNCAFVFLAKHKVNEVFVAHFTCLVGLELSRHLIKDAVDCFAAECVAFVPAEIFFVYYKIVI
jgi:hypothetical protein